MLQNNYHIYIHVKLLTEYILVSLVMDLKYVNFPSAELICMMYVCPSTAVFYCAGHGVMHAGKHYLMPWDHPEGTQTNECLCLEEVESKINKMNPELLVIAMDICRQQ